MKQYGQTGTGLNRLPLVRFHYRIFGIINFSLLLAGLLSHSSNVVLTKLVNDGWSNSSLNVVSTSALVFGYFTSSLTGRFIGDYFGRRGVFRINLLIIGIAAAGAAFVPNAHWLIFFRPLIGARAGVLIVVDYASFTELIPTTMCGKWSARLSFVGNWLPVLSTAIDVVVITFFSRRIMFLLGDIGILLAWFLLNKYFVESP